MRLVPIKFVENYSVLGKSIYDSDGRILLRAGIMLTKSLIRKIEQHKIFSVYIRDKYSPAEIDEIIKPEVRQKSISIIKKNFLDIEVLVSAYKSQKCSKKDYEIQKEKILDSINSVAEELLENVLGNKSLMCSLIDIKNIDNYTYAHCVNVAIISIVLGLSLNLSKISLYHLCVGALMHDIGKMFISRDILKKPGKLTKEEFETIKKHSRYGYEFCSDLLNLSAHSKLIVFQHHERIDGLGYPDKISGDKISYLAKIVSIADVYDALTSDRPYKNAMSANDALEYLISNSDTAFDYEIVNAFYKKIVIFPKGTMVNLSNGDVGIVERVISNFPLRPVIKIVKSHNYNKINSNMNLMTELSVVISDVKYNI